MADPGVTTNQFLTFTLDDDVYAMDIEAIREVLEVTSITKIPRTPAYMRGVINLRGHAVPVMDLRMKFNMGEVSQTVETCIIIAEVDHGGDKALIGALVDAVHEVYEMPPETIETAPKMGTEIRADFIAGIGRKDDSFVVILDNRKIFSEEELALAQESSRLPGDDQEAGAGGDDDRALPPQAENQARAEA